MINNYEIFGRNYSYQVLCGKADANKRSDYGVTPLMAAVEDGNIEAVKILLNADANVNAQDEFGVTALMRATSHGYFYIAKILIGAGADADLQDEDGMTALHWGADFMKRILFPKKKKF